MRKTYSDKLFTVNISKGTLDLNRDEAREIKSFREIISRDKGGKVKGDADGRKKLFAKKELYYVYIMADWFNMYAILNDKRRHQRALEDTGLIRIEGWKPDQLIEDAILAYRNDMHELSPIAKAYLNSRSALDALGEDIALLNEYGTDLRNKIKDAKKIASDMDEYGEEKQKAEQALSSYLTKLNQNNKEVLNLTNTLPDRIDALDKLKVKLSKEDSERDEIIGGGHVHRREEPR